MLKRGHPARIAHRDAMYRSFGFLGQQPWSTGMTILVITVTLMLAALSWMAAYQVSAFRSSWQNSSHISLYLADTLSSDEQQGLLSRIQTMEETANVAFVPASDGLALLSQQDGMEDIIQYLPNNPLPSVIVVTPGPHVNTPAAIKNFHKLLKKLPGVNEAKLDKDWVERLYSGLSFLTQVTQCLMALLAITVMLVIGNTLRLIIYRRQDEIHVLQLLGATDAFIMRPFLYSGIWYGLFSASLALVLADGVMMILRTGINQWAQPYQMHFTLPMLPMALVFGILLGASILGWLAANLTVRRYTLYGCVT
jgi:cell division transport system permease protein